jgi:hypothetical protein
LRHIDIVGPVWEEKVKVFGECISEGAHLKSMNCTIGGKAMEAENLKLAHVGSRIEFEV